MPCVNTGAATVSKLPFLSSQPQPAHETDDDSSPMILSYVKILGPDIMDDAALAFWTSTTAGSDQETAPSRDNLKDCDSSLQPPGGPCTNCRSKPSSGTSARCCCSLSAPDVTILAAEDEVETEEKNKRGDTRQAQRVPSRFLLAPSESLFTARTSQDSGETSARQERSSPDSEGRSAPGAEGRISTSSAVSGRNLASPSDLGDSLPDPIARPAPPCDLSQASFRTSFRGSSVELPERYRQALTRSGSYGNVGGCYGSGSSYLGTGSGGCDSQDLTSRERDLGTALAWIRNEMVQMKEQDKVLLKRFIELRASILQLRCMFDLLGSSSDLRLDGSCASLNEARKTPRMRSLARADSEAPGSSRGEHLYKAASSLSLPCSPQLSRLRWNSDELM